MQQPYVITIGREFGSGGREVGQKLAKRLGIDYLDKEILTIAAKESGISESVFESVDEKVFFTWLYPPTLGTYAGFYNPLTGLDAYTDENLYSIQANVIKKVADLHSCIIVGRSADYILRDNPHCINVFVHADMKTRIQRIMDVYNLTEKEAKASIKKADKQRSNYYETYSGRKWTDLRNYHLSLSTSFTGVDKCVDILEQSVQIHFRKS